MILFPGASVATSLRKGFLAIRKAGHLCVVTQSQNYSDYTGREKTMEVRVDVLKPGPSPLVCFYRLTKSATYCENMSIYQLRPEENNLKYTQKDDGALASLFLAYKSNRSCRFCSDLCFDISRSGFVQQMGQIKPSSPYIP